MRFLFILITNFFFLFNTVFSQQSSKIYGSINDEENNPLIGINIYNKDTDKLLVTSRTIWCLISSKSGKPTRITNEIKEAFKK